MATETRSLVAAMVVSGVAAWLLLAEPSVPHTAVASRALVLAYFVALGAATQLATTERGVLWGYVTVAVSGVAVALVVTGTLPVTTMAGALVLFLVALGLFDLADRYGVPPQVVPGPWAKRVFVVVVVLAALVVAVDVASGGLTYELRTDGEVRVNQRGMQAPLAFLGEVVVTNPGPFSQRVDFPAYKACAAGNWSAYRPEAGDGERRPVSVYLQADGYYGQYVTGFGQHRYGAILLFDAVDIDGEQFAVRRTEQCPDDPNAAPYLAVYEAKQNGS